MCRSIKTLRRPDTAATTGELEAAARQYVRKISGYRTPAARNADAFDAAIVEVAAASQRLLDAIGVDIEEGPDRWTPRRIQSSYRSRFNHLLRRVTGLLPTPRSHEVVRLETAGMCAATRAARRGSRKAAITTVAWATPPSAR